MFLCNTNKNRQANTICVFACVLSKIKLLLVDFAFDKTKYINAFRVNIDYMRTRMERRWTMYMRNVLFAFCKKNVFWRFIIYKWMNFAPLTFVASRGII